MYDDLLAWMDKVMNFARAGLYMRTIAYLRIEQILYGLWFRVRSMLPVFLLFKIRRPPGKIEVSKIKFKISNPEYASFDNAKIAGKYFCFLNDPADYNSKIDWRAYGKSRLWRYNLNYFHYLRPKGGLDSHRGVSMIMDWIENNPPGTVDAWDPYPISLRIVNWIKYLSEKEISGADCERISHSIYQQCLWLEHSIERHLLCNHLFKNAKALIFSGLFFSSADSKRWLSKGLRLLKRELRTQILPDGGHIERSTMYHCMILEDCLDLFNICGDHSCKDLQDISVQLQETAGRMLYFLLGMTHPDKQIALFNDSALETEVSPPALKKYYEDLTGRAAAEPASSVWSFPDTGYFVMAPKPGDLMIIDCGAIGPDYQPGHGHCDMLSFELSVNNMRVIVDSGCFSYEDEEMRQYNRGNAGHNTVTLNGTDQSEIWAAYRCARRARPAGAGIWRDGETLYFEGRHDGYRRFPGQPVHIRRIKWKGAVITIEDEVYGGSGHDVDARLHINPACNITERDKEIHVGAGEFTVKIQPLGGLDFRVDEGWYSPSFGKRIPCPVLIEKGYKEAPFKTGWMISLLQNK